MMTIVRERVSERYKVRLKMTRWRERMREEFDEHFAPLSLLRITAAFDPMSSWYSVGYGWSEPFDSQEWTSTWRLERATREPMVLADVQYREQTTSGTV